MFLMKFYPTDQLTIEYQGTDFYLLCGLLSNHCGVLGARRNLFDALGGERYSSEESRARRTYGGTTRSSSIAFSFPQSERIRTSEWSVQRNAEFSLNVSNKEVIFGASANFLIFNMFNIVGDSGLTEKQTGVSILNSFKNEIRFFLFTICSCKPFSSF